MANLNPLQLLSLIRGGNPQVLAQQIFQNNFPSDPNMQNLMQMAQKGDNQGIQQFAQQFFGQRGKDFNTEINTFLSLLRGR